MRIALLRVNSTADEVIPPFGLGYLASAARKAGHEVVVVDALRERLDGTRLITRLCSISPNIVGVLLFTKDLVPVRGILRGIRRNLPGVRTVVGGPHPSAVPGETLDFLGDSIDYVFAGEAEEGFPMLLGRIENGAGTSLRDIPGLVFREGGGEIRANPRRFREDIDMLDVAWDLMPPGTYPRAPHGAYFRKFPVAPIVTSRGCPFQCTFCAVECISGRKIRRRSVENVVDEIALLRDRYGVREIHIEDDNFTGNKPYILSFCEEVRRRAPGLTWTCPNGVRIDTLDSEMLHAMKDAGLYFLSVGIESGSDRVLRSVRKSLSVAETEEKVRLIHDAGIGVSGFFILGIPGETQEEMETTVDLALRLPLARATFSNFQPFPGCEEFKRLRESGEFAVDWETFGPTLQSTTYHPRGTTEEALRRLRKRALRRFYARPSIAWGMLREIRSWDHAAWVLRRGWRWLSIER